MITSLADVSEFPLCWPADKPRAAERQGSPFKASIAKALASIETEMRRWRAIDWTISRSPAYRRGPSDPAVALWWSMRGKGPVPELRVLACDQYVEPAANAQAIALTLQALRGCDRWGAYTREQAIEGARLALPGPGVETPRRPWHVVLGVANDAPLVVAEAAYRALAKAHQGPESGLVELNLAIEQARKRDP